MPDSVADFAPRLQITTVKTPPCPSVVTWMSRILRFGYCDVERSLPSQALTRSIAPPGSDTASAPWNRKTRVSAAGRSNIDLTPAPATCPVDATIRQHPARVPPATGDQRNRSIASGGE